MLGCTSSPAAKVTRQGRPGRVVAHENFIVPDVLYHKKSYGNMIFVRVARWHSWTHSDDFFFFCPLLERFSFFSNICPVGVRFAQTVVHFAHFKVQPGQEKGCFGVRLGVFCVHIYP